MDQEISGSTLSRVTSQPPSVRVARRSLWSRSRLHYDVPRGLKDHNPISWSRQSGKPSWNDQAAPDPRSARSTGQTRTRCSSRHLTYVHTCIHAPMPRSDLEQSSARSSKATQQLQWVMRSSNFVFANSKTEIQLTCFPPINECAFPTFGAVGLVLFPCNIVNSAHIWSTNRRRILPFRVHPSAIADPVAHSRHAAGFRRRLSRNTSDSLRPRQFDRWVLSVTRASSRASIGLLNKPRRPGGFFGTALCGVTVYTRSQHTVRTMAQYTRRGRGAVS